MALIDKNVIVTEYEGLRVDCIQFEDVKKAVLEFNKILNDLQDDGYLTDVDLVLNKYKEIFGSFN